MSDAKLNRAWSVLEIKTINEDLRIIEGMATTPRPDRMEDVVNPNGAKFKLPLPFLMQHDASPESSVGHVIEATVTDKGIRIRAQIERDPLLPELDKAWARIKKGLVRGLSIGFRSLEPPKPIEGTRFGVLWDAWEWLELSAVVVPANADCNIATIKSCDLASREVSTIKSIDGTQPRAASGTARPVVSLKSLPGVSGKKVAVPETTPKGIAMRTIAEQIASFEAKRAASTARMEEIMAKAADEGRTLEDTETEEYDGLQSEVKAVDNHLVRLKAHEKTISEKAEPVTPEAGKTPDAGTQTRTSSVTWGKSNLPKGTGFTRVAISLMRAKGDSFQALENAKMYKDQPEVEQAVRASLYAKAAVAAGNTTDATWAGPLVVYQNLASEFVDLLRPATILGKLAGVRNVPFNISIPRTTAGSTSSWVGEDDPKPVSRMSFETITLGHTKIATIVVLSEELVQDSNPAAEGLVQADMIAAIAAYSDAQFIDPTVTASGTIRPASITHGLTTHNMTGTAVTNVLADVQTLMGGFVSGNVSFQNAVWIMHPRTALYLSMLLSPLGTLQFPGINVNGGTFMGFPVITSASVPIDTGDDTYIVLINAADVLLAESGINVDVSREASLQMDSAPSDSAASLISLWQKNLVGLRAERRICYRRRRESSVQVLSAVSY